MGMSGHASQQKIRDIRASHDPVGKMHEEVLNLLSASFNTTFPWA